MAIGPSQSIGSDKVYDTSQNESKGLVEVLPAKKVVNKNIELAVYLWAVQIHPLVNALSSYSASSCPPGMPRIPMSLKTHMPNFASRAHNEMLKVFEKFVKWHDAHCGDPTAKCPSELTPKQFEQITDLKNIKIWSVSPRTVSTAPELPPEQLPQYRLTEDGRLLTLTIPK